MTADTAAPSVASLSREGKTIEEQIASAQGHDLLSLLRNYLAINLKPSDDLARLYIARINALLSTPTLSDLPSDGTCVRCGAAPRNASGLCATCVDEDAERAGEIPPTPSAARERIARLWQDLLDKDDRTSPEEYPDMALITFDEFEQSILALLPDAAAIRADAEMLDETLATLKHARVFISSREKMHPQGIELFDELTGRIAAAIRNAGMTG